MIRNFLFIMIAIAILPSCSKKSRVNSLLQNRQFYKASKYCDNIAKSDQSKCYIEIAKSYEAKHFLKMASKFYIKAGDIKSGKRIFLKLASKYKKEQNYEQALQFYSLADAKDEITKIYETIAEIFVLRGSYETAIEYYKKTNNQKKIRYINKLLGDKFYNQGLFKRSIPFYQKAEIPVNNIYRKIAERFIKKQAYFQAIPYFDLAGVKAKKYYTLIGRDCLNHNKYANAAYFFEKSGIKKDYYLNLILTKTKENKEYYEFEHYLVKTGISKLQASSKTGETAEKNRDFFDAAFFYFKGKNRISAQRMYVKILSSNKNSHKKQYTKARNMLLTIVNKDSIKNLNQITSNSSPDIKKLVKLINAKILKTKLAVANIQLGLTGKFRHSGLNIVSTIRTRFPNIKRVLRRSIGRKKARIKKFKIKHTKINEDKIIKYETDITPALKISKSSNSDIIFILSKNFTQKTGKKIRKISLKMKLSCIVMIPALKSKQSFFFSINHNELYGKKHEKESKTERKISRYNWKRKLKTMEKKIEIYLKRKLKISK